MARSFKKLFTHFVETHDGRCGSVRDYGTRAGALRAHSKTVREGCANVSRSYVREYTDDGELANQWADWWSTFKADK